MSAVAGLLKSMEIRSGHSEMSIMMQASTIEECLLSGVLLCTLEKMCIVWMIELVAMLTNTISGKGHQKPHFPNMPQSQAC